MRTDKRSKQTLNSNARCSTPSQHYSITSRMAEGGIIFSDGIVDDVIEFNSGTIANIAVAKIQGKLVCN